MKGRKIKKFGDDRDWFFAKSFGMFVHWGLYSISAWHEQVMWRKGQDRDAYGKLIHKFNPVGFDPDKWLDLAEETGMEYLTITTKHHEGFCLWDTAYTNFNIMHTPYGKDIIGELAAACHKRKFPLCLYYSVADWHHPNYPNRGKSGISHELPEPLPEDEPNENKYVEFLKNQIRELCTNYGEIHGIWWDVNKLTYRDLEINQMIHTLQPKAVINDRGFSPGDFVTSERDYNAKKQANTREFCEPIQACQSVGMESWGYRQNESYYTAKYLEQSIDRMMGMGANYLLNVGPRPDGTIAEEDIRLLKDIGKWYCKVRESLVDVEPCSDLTLNQEVLLTTKDNTLYVHMHRDPKSTTIVLEPLHTLPRKVTLLNNGQSLEACLDDLPRFFNLEHDILCVRNLPVSSMREEVMVLKLEFDNIADLKQLALGDKQGFQG